MSCERSLWKRGLLRSCQRLLSGKKKLENEQLFFLSQIYLSHEATILNRLDSGFYFVGALYRNILFLAWAQDLLVCVILNILPPSSNLFGGAALCILFRAAKTHRQDFWSWFTDIWPAGFSVCCLDVTGSSHGFIGKLFLKSLWPFCALT